MNATMKPIPLSRKTPQLVRADPAPSLIWRLLPLWIILASIVAAIVLVVTFKKPPAEKSTPQTARLVEAVTAEQTDLRYRVETFGTVEPRTETTLTAEVAGRVVHVADAFAAGAFVRRGDLLLEIDPGDYRAALISAEANLASRQAQLADAEARTEQARKDWQQLNPDKEPNALVLRLPQLEEARAAVRSADADLLNAQRDLARTRIAVPYDAIVESRDANLGQYISVNATLGGILAVDSAEVRLALTDEDLQYLDLPPPGRIVSDGPEVILRAGSGGRQRQWAGRIVRLEGVIDSATRVTYAVAEIADPYGLLGTEREAPLKAGTFVEATILGRQAEGVIAVPRAAIRSGNTVLIATPDETIDIRRVEIDRMTTDKAYIAGGIAPGERVITTAITAPVPGMAIRLAAPTEETPPGETSDQAEPGAVAGDNGAAPEHNPQNA